MPPSPSCLGRCFGDGLSLLSRQRGGPRLTALEPAQSAERDRSGILAALRRFALSHIQLG